MCNLKKNLTLGKHKICKDSFFSVSFFVKYYVVQILHIYFYKCFNFLQENLEKINKFLFLFLNYFLALVRKVSCFYFSFLFYLIFVILKDISSKKKFNKMIFQEKEQVKQISFGWGESEKCKSWLRVDYVP